ncbi:MAG TPA: hypothetical protein VKA86_11765 [Candidatus Krumholzibacteria bacterium]|nr:hypothetical protein [Candidatus Krumholzibacteria bacterium]
MADDSFRFLRPWHQLLPPAGDAVVAVAGSGGCTTTLLRLLRVYRERGARVLVSQTTAHPVPFALREQRCAPDQEAVRGSLDAHGVAWTGEGDGDRPGGLAPERLDALARESGAEVLLVEAQASAGVVLRSEPEPAPVWPRRLQLALAVGNLAAVGRPYGPRTVVDVDEPQFTDDGDPRRVRTEEVTRAVRSVLATVPETARPLPFLTGFGAFRDIDGMFDLVQELVDPPRRPVVCLAELLGDERRDTADARDRAGESESPWHDDERVYAIYPAWLDENV